MVRPTFVAGHETSRSEAAQVPHHLLQVGGQGYMATPADRILTGRVSTSDGGAAVSVTLLELPCTCGKCDDDELGFASTFTLSVDDARQIARSIMSVADHLEAEAAASAAELLKRMGSAR